MLVSVIVVAEEVSGLCEHVKRGPEASTCVVGHPNIAVRLEPAWAGSLVSTLLKNKKMHPSPMHFRGWEIRYLMRIITRCPEPHQAWVPMGSACPES